MGVPLEGDLCYAEFMADPQPKIAAQGRPFLLDPMFRALTALPGIGPKSGKLVEKLVGGGKLLDLLFHRPIDMIDRRFAPKVADAPDGQIATLTVTVMKHFPNERRNQPYKVWCTDETGAITLVFFNAHKDFVEKHLPEGATVVVSGKVEHYAGKVQMVHPDAMGPVEDRAAIETIEPVYPLTAGVTNKALRKAVAAALSAVPEMAEWAEPHFKRRNGWPGFKEALTALHFLTPSLPPAGGRVGEGGLALDGAKQALPPPLTPPPARAGGGELGWMEGGAAALLPEHPARQRLAYDEMLANQLALALVRYKNRRQNGRSFQCDGHLRQKLLAALPFKLTGAQARALEEIYADMASPLRMLRLLQGDVGSGKTVVAAMALLNAVECGAQGALMAPTEILARQHGASLKPLLDAIGIRFVVLTGRDKGRLRDTLLQQIANGAAQIVIGTHALFQDEVVFADLGLAVVDEQHKFGVHQRLQLSGKGKGVDVLVMTATPIPRTLTLTSYGDMDVSRLDEKPPGRKPIDTRLIPQDKLDDVVDGVERQMNAGARVYWVCPLVEESEFMDLAAAQERYEILQARFGARVGIVHGRMKAEEKDETMRRFAAGELSLLIATTVIEVGVNVPEATIMVIEHAERFGLAQLHQLRGRVGRGGDKSYCFLIYTTPAGKTAKERLTTMRDTEDGFLIAEKDLQLRGAGDLLGTRQSGDVRFRLADLSAHVELLAAASDDARLIIDKDPELQSERGQALRTLLYMFEQDQAIRYMRSG
jgi:ATP-dependent DNA helicase RecG